MTSSCSTSDDVSMYDVTTIACDTLSFRGLRKVWRYQWGNQKQWRSYLRTDNTFVKEKRTRFASGNSWCLGMFYLRWRIHVWRHHNSMRYITWHIHTSRHNNSIHLFTGYEDNSKFIVPLMCISWTDFKTDSDSVTYFRSIGQRHVDCP
jgi:hypothetical protein